MGEHWADKIGRELDEIRKREEAERVLLDQANVVEAMRQNIAVGEFLRRDVLVLPGKAEAIAATQTIERYLAWLFWKVQND